MVTVTIDGKTETIPLDEALQGYQRHWTTAARLRSSPTNAAMDEQAKAVAEERQTYATMLGGTPRSAAAAARSEPNWDEVYQADPVGYARKRDEWRTTGQDCSCAT